MIDHAEEEEELCCLRISRPQCQRGRQVEDAAGAVDRRPHGGGRVEEVHLEQPQARVRAVQGPQVLRLALIICKGEKIKIPSRTRNDLHFIWRAEQRGSMLPRFLTVAWTV